MSGGGGVRGEPGPTVRVLESRVAQDRFEITRYAEQPIWWKSLDPVRQQHPSLEHHVRVSTFFPRPEHNLKTGDMVRGNIPRSPAASFGSGSSREIVPPPNTAFRLRRSARLEATLQERKALEKRTHTRARPASAACSSVSSRTFSASYNPTQEPHLCCTSGTPLSPAGSSKSPDTLRPRPASAHSEASRHHWLHGTTESGVGVVLMDGKEGQCHPGPGSHSPEKPRTAPLCASFSRGSRFPGCGSPATTNRQSGGSSSKPQSPLRRRMRK